MTTFFGMLSPSYLLFPALLGTVILGLVCPLIGSYLVLRRTVFLGLTLPQIAAAGVSFTFWLQQTGLLPHYWQSERAIGMLGSLLFTFLGMGFLGYLEQRGKGLAEGRLAAAYALAGALTILFMVFNPAGQIEVLNLLKGEVIGLSQGELKLLGTVFGSVFVAMIVFRREFLLTSFDRDLAFLLKGRQVLWDVLLYLFAGVSIALGVIMAGPLLLFGFLVLPALAARPLVSRMSSFLSLASLLGVVMAVFGFYSSVRLDLPLGPTDVAFGCGLIFLAYALRRASPRAGVALVLLAALSLCTIGCSMTPGVPVPEAKSLDHQPIWLAKVRNDTGSALLLPSNNPLRSLAEMAGKLSSDYRQSVMDLLRERLRRELEQRGFAIASPEEKDARLSSLPFDTQEALRVAREGKLSGLVFLSEIWRWEVDGSRGMVRVLVDFKMIRVEDGGLLWQRRVQRAVPTPSATYVGQASTDAIDAIVREIFS